MANALDKSLYHAIEKNFNSTTIKQLIEQGADCNLAYFNLNTYTFISSIRLAAKCDRHATLRLLYEYRNSPTETQIKKHLAFYLNHHDESQEQSEKNELLFDYTISRLLYTRITQHHPIVFHTLINALHSYDNGKLRGQALDGGSEHQIFLQLRIYTLFKKLIRMKIKSNTDDETFKILMNELIYNLEIYYFLDSISRIPFVITESMMTQSFTQIQATESFPLLMTYYKSIAKNVIKKLEELDIDQEYTIPTGWYGHAVCVSFRRINETHIHIRIDDPSPSNPINTDVTIPPTDSGTQIKPHVLGQLNRNNLQKNVNYFILLIDSVLRDLLPQEGINLIYNVNNQIDGLARIRTENVPSFDVQAKANCFVKCYEAGARMRFGRAHPKLYERLLLSEQNTANLLVQRSKEERKSDLTPIIRQFIVYTEQENISRLVATEKISLQDRLKTSYRQQYQYLASSINGQSNVQLIEKYVPLGFEINEKPLELKNFFLNRSRVLLVADAGCGKTTVCQYITYLWTQSELWRNQYEWVFYIKMRNLNEIKYPFQIENYSLIDIIQKECFQEYQLQYEDKQNLKNLLKNSFNILWILDGYDERTIPDYLYTVDRELFTKPNLLLTSRPYISDVLKDLPRICLQHFNEDDIENYINKYFSPMFRTTAAQCCLLVKYSPQLQKPARIPACLEIICSLWNRNEEVFEFCMTTGELYEKMCEHLLQRYLLKFHKKCPSALAGKNIFKLPDSIVFTHLERLAFQATQLHRFIISGEELIDRAGSTSESVLQLGLLVEEKRTHSRFVLPENTYYFVHRSFQEYLCARYMINALSSNYSEEQKKEVMQFIANEKYDRNLEKMFDLFFELEPSVECTQQFWSVVDSEPRDLVGIRHCARIIRWFSKGSCIIPREKENIDNRTVEVIKAWMFNTDRQAHDRGNTYLFEWFDGPIEKDVWLQTWKEDLDTDNPASRRYFLPDLWSSKNIQVLKNVFGDFTEEHVKSLYHLITKGPTTRNLQCLNLEPSSFTLYTVNNQNEVPELLKESQRKAREHQSVTTLEEFQLLLRNYTAYAHLNRQAMAKGEVIWELKIHPSALENIDHQTLKLLLQLVQKDKLFHRHFELPIASLLYLYAKSTHPSDQILCSLIVSIAFSTDCLLTASSSSTNKKSIQVYPLKEADEFLQIDLDEQPWIDLMNAFKTTRHTYGYSSFYLNEN